MPVDFVMRATEEKIREILEIHDTIIPVDQDLFTYGLDSLKTVILVVELEDAFDIMFEDKELLFENFATIQLVADLVKRKLVTKDDQSQRVD
ncbi:acyl carrier protein [Paenibacillus periandrae]|uniref:acyl carrier protein n=1 Tax=Paenibacillus periandrae TaxID=1761741 RepID=UPI001F093FD5|nr:phosphopantetheine-binding protein [Paenibacillus periandrae]